MYITEEDKIIEMVLWFSLAIYFHRNEKKVSKFEAQPMRIVQIWREQMEKFSKYNDQETTTTLRRNIFPISISCVDICTTRTRVLSLLGRNLRILEKLCSELSIFSMQFSKILNTIRSDNSNTSKINQAVSSRTD